MDMRIPFVVKDSIVTIYDHWAAQDILAYLRIGVNPNSNKDWIRIINKMSHVFFILKLKIVNTHFQ